VAPTKIASHPVPDLTRLFYGNIREGVNSHDSHLNISSEVILGICIYTKREDTTGETLQ
jgi:hypothetical protein